MAPLDGSESEPESESIVVWAEPATSLGAALGKTPKDLTNASASCTGPIRCHRSAFLLGSGHRGFEKTSASIHALSAQRARIVRLEVLLLPADL